MQVSMLVLGVLASAPLLTGCDLMENQLKTDREGFNEVQDYRAALAARPLEKKSATESASGIPQLQQYVAQPSGSLKAMPLVSISINQTVPLRDALYELAQQAGYDIELDPRITGSVIFSAKDKPFDEVIDRLADIAGLRYKFDEHSVRVELDTPYQKIYKIDYLAYVRKNKSTIHNDISVVSGGGASTGSGYQMDGESEADFWGELSSNLQQILGVAETVSTLKTKADPQLTAVAKNPPVQQVNGGANGGAAATAQDAAAKNKATAEAQQPQTTPPQAVLQVNSLPTDPNAQPADQGGEANKAEQPSFSLNKQAGMISVFASDRQHDKIKAYLNTLKKSVTMQVLIEAKVMEVGLSDEFSAGIDWDILNQINGKINAGLDVTGGTLARSILDPTPSPATNFRLAYATNDVTAVVDAISRFGTVHALASPRLTVLNNQSAVLNVANNLVYFTVDITTTTSANSPAQTTVDSEVHNVPEGVLINVQPSINAEDKTISLAVRPTITRKIAEVNDPAVAFQAGVAGVDITSAVPVMNVQEMDSIINMHSGQAIIMGGLMQDRAQSTQQGIPVLGEVPLLGSLFRNQGDRIQKTELVIFLKATILDDGKSNVSETDKDLYKKFGSDRRPLDL